MAYRFSHLIPSGGNDAKWLPSIPDCFVHGILPFRGENHITAVSKANPGAWFQ
jgi:hypothetical protein